jgi:hypothetical protein
MYAKINGGTVTQFPYTIGDLRKDNSNVSFPKNIPTSVMQNFNMVGVLEGAKPTPTVYQTVQRNDVPTKVGDSWVINYTAVDMFADTTDEEGVTTTKAQHEENYQVALDLKTAKVNRNVRDSLISETDFYALTDVVMNADVTVYRQALRDITSHVNWPNLNEADWPVKL